jgi:hypothetical protein
MKTGTMLAATLALASIPLMAQQSPTGNPAMQPGNSPGQQSNPPGAMPETQASPAAVPDAPVAEMRPVSGELVSKLDSKTAKSGDDVVVQTKAAMKTADGTEIPEGSKVMGHVVAVQASTGGQNSQLVLRFDHAELTGGKSVPIQSEIRSIGSADNDASATGSAATSEAPTTGAATPSAGAGGRMNGAASASAASPTTPSGTQSAAGNSGPAAGTVVARNGKIAISATSIPGVMVANNEPGQQDPRMAQASSILLGAKKDVQLAGGTPVVLGVSATK